jgi:hypothetical protein
VTDEHPASPIVPARKANAAALFLKVTPEFYMAFAFRLEVTPKNGLAPPSQTVFFIRGTHGGTQNDRNDL